jgi:hypothetical protein
MERYHNVIGFIGFFVAVVLLMRICNAIDKKLKNRSAKKRGFANLKVGSVITNKIPEPAMPSIPIWGNAIVENRETGKRLPVCIDTTGMWHLGGEETVPLRLSNREWFIVDKR